MGCVFVEETFYEVIKNVSRELYYKALTRIPEDVKKFLSEAYKKEASNIGKKILNTILYNIEYAEKQGALVCQDTGSPVYIVEIGEIELNINKLFQAIRKGVEEATKRYYLRPNMVHPITRENTGTNTGRYSPAIYLEPREGLGEVVRIIAMPKGSGSENMSALKMLPPAAGIVGVKKFVIETILNAGGKGCPPYIVGIGIGGTFDSVTYLAKKAVFRSLGTVSNDPVGRELEKELLDTINNLGIGPMGLGGNTTAIAVHVEVGETHISSIPVAVNIQCWRGERASAIVSRNGAIKYE